VRPQGSPVAALDDSIFARPAPVRPLATFAGLVAALPFAAAADMFVSEVFCLGKIAGETSKLLDERKGYVKGTPWRSAFIGLALLSLLALTCGAIIPMLYPGVSSVVYLWVPSAIYVLAGLAGIGGAIASFRI
jgi:hypothetical protein